MKRIAIFALAALVGCTSMPTVQQIGTPRNFAKCATADVVTTTIGLSANTMHEVDPLVKALTIHGLGRVAGIVVPVIGLSIAGYYLLKWINKPALTATATVLTCVTAIHNSYLVVTHAPGAGPQ